MTEESLFVEGAPYWSVVGVEGKDRVAWLNGLVSCDVLKLAPGQAMLGLVVGRTGKIMADLWIASAGERLLLVLPRATQASVHAHLDAHIIMEDAELVDASLSASFHWGAQAANSSEYVALRGETLGVLRFTELVAGGEDVHETEASQAARLARGILRFGPDFDATMLPHEASLDKIAVSFSKGCYLGQEVVCMVEMRGQVKRRMVKLTAPGPIASGAEVTAPGGEVIGQTKTTGQLAGGAFAAFALIKRKIAETPNATVLVSGVACSVHAI
jgi:tRNA-modifying protein YgfZ